MFWRKKDKPTVVVFADRGANLEHVVRVKSGVEFHLFIKNPGRDVWAIAPHGSTMVRTQIQDRKKPRRKKK